MGKDSAKHKCLKYLNLHIDFKLSWEQHVNHICKKMHHSLISWAKHPSISRWWFQFPCSLLSDLPNIIMDIKIHPLLTLQNKAIKKVFGLPHLNLTVNLYLPIIIMNITQNIHIKLAHISINAYTKINTNLQRPKCSEPANNDYNPIQWF